MSCVCILTPVVIASWPVFSTAVVSAATALGYQLAASSVDEIRKDRAVANKPRQITLDVPRSEIVTGQLDRDQRIKVTRDGVSVVFSRDARGRGTLSVTGSGHTDKELREMGEELSLGVVQNYVYQRLKDEMAARQFVVVEEEVNEDKSIRIKVRHWEN